MKFLVMIFIDEQQENRYGPEEWKKLDVGYAEFYGTAVGRGYTVEGGALEGPSTAKTLRVRAGRSLVTDGPFADSKEWIGGYFIVEAPTFEDVAAVCRLMPGAQSNAVEIRQITPPSNP